MFDCVLPTRLARHGKVLTPTGDFNIRRAEFRADGDPLQADCPCPTCATYSRAYLRHLVMTGELTAMRLLSMHNLTYTLGVLREARQAILEGRFETFRLDHRSRRGFATRPGS